jgi:hypothetical protein
MLTLKDFMEVVDYRITEGSDFTWRCFGPEAKPYSLSAWNNDHDGWSFNIVFDTGTQEVYMAEACDYKHNRAYRLINPVHLNSYRNYGSVENPKYLNQAWDDVDFVDLESDDDWIQKALAIKAGEDYDTRVSIPLDLDKEEVFKLMQMAHERDLTLNEFVEELLWKVIEIERAKDRVVKDS